MAISLAEDQPVAQMGTDFMFQKNRQTRLHLCRLTWTHGPECPMDGTNTSTSKCFSDKFATKTYFYQNATVANSNVDNITF